jgi:hypothetical protein
MDLFTRNDLQTLLADRPGPCVWIFLPTHRGGKEEDPIRTGIYTDAFSW